MIVPGSNILNMAMTIIHKQTVIYYHYLGRTTNDIGQYISEFSSGVPLQGSFQPIQRNLYQKYGLDFQHSYFTFYAPRNVLDINRNTSSDHIAFSGDRFQCLSNVDWFYLDGWDGILCVRLQQDWAQQSVIGFNQQPALNSYTNFNNGNYL